ncbi:MAG: 2Fe-2S iron-sulfur cluster binding domain-containing protein [Fimbriimonadaceae bacterium]|nr:MAG: 2Fe-2S iron-sulfur cluster binding domain-containing protein [Fimbriimonadaceae bacterium]
MIEFCGENYESKPSETVLETLLRHKVQVGYSCMQGDCLSCVLRCVEGTPTAESQEGLTRRMQRTGHFKACVCPAELVQVVTRAGG